MSWRLHAISGWCVLVLIQSMVCGQAPPSAREGERPEARGPEVHSQVSVGLVGAATDGDEGVRVISVDANSAASLAGVEPDDIVIGIDGMAVRTLEDMARLLKQKRPGDSARFTIRRAGKRRELNISFAPAPATLPPSEQSPAPPVLGVVVQDASDALRQRFGFQSPTGAVITAIEAGSPAHRGRLPLGGVIVDIDGTAIEKADDVAAVLRQHREGDAVEITYLIGRQRYHATVRLAPPAPPAVVVPAPAPAAGRPVPPLENLLNRDGRRPLLGRLGRVLDGVLDDAAGGGSQGADSAPATPAPAPGDTPAPPEAADADVQLLRAEIDVLRREIELLRKRIEQLEKR